MLQNFLNIYTLSIVLLMTSCDGQNKTQMVPERQDSLAVESVIIERETEKKSDYTSADVITSGIIDSQGDLWFGTSTKGVIRYNGEKFTVYSKDQGLCNNHVSSIVEDKNGTLWFGTADGLCKFDGNNFTHVPIPEYDDRDFPTNSKEVLTLIQSQNGDIWLGTWGGGAYRYDGEEFEAYLQEDGFLYDDGFHHNAIQSIVEDTDGNIWFASMSHGGVSRFDGEKMVHFSTSDGLGDNMVFSCFQDKEGKMWFGTRDGGMSSYDGESFTTYTTDDGLCNNNVSCFMDGKSGELWIGSFRRSGVCVYENGTFSSFPTQDRLLLEDIRVIMEDKNGDIWFAGRYGALWCFDGKHLKEFTNSWEKS